MGLSVGREVGEQPMLSKEGVGPEMMVYPPTPSALALTAAKDTSKTHPYPAVQELEREFAAVLEVFKPAPVHGVDATDDLLQAQAVGATRQPPDLGFVLRQV